MKTTTIGIVGFGFMGQVHLKYLSQMKHVKILGICDIDETQFAHAPADMKTYNNPAELIADKDIDVILISSNNDTHRHITEMAANAGKHVLCEKPVALSLEDLDAMTAVCKKNNVSFTVHQQRRFDKDFRTAKAVFESGTLGDMYTVQSALYGFNGNMHDWHVYMDQGGGMLYDWGVHLLDQLLWMIPGKIKSMYADIRNVINTEVDDYFNVMMRFDSGVTATLELGTYFLADKPGWFDRHWFIGGNKGSMHVDGFDPKGAIVRTSELLTNVAGQRTFTVAGPTRSFGDPPLGRILTEALPAVDVNHLMYFDNYFAALNGNDEFLVTIPEVRRVLRLMDAVRESAATMKSIDFE